ncbi:MAG: glycosyltransferase family 4 protein [Vicinamibacterales bacterium]
MAERPGLKILRVIARLNTGGPARHVLLLDRGLRRRGHQTHLIHGEVGAYESSAEPLADALGVPCTKWTHLGRRLNPVADLRAVVELARLLRRERPDVVHTHTSKAGLVGRLAAWVHNAMGEDGRRCAVIHTYHGHIFDGYFPPAVTRAVVASERLLARVTDRIVTISPRQREDIVSRYRVAAPAQVTIIPLGLDLEPLLQLTKNAPDLRQSLGLAADAVVIGFVGRLVPIKDVQTLLRAFALARRQVRTLVLVVAGDGPMRPDLVALAQTLGILGAVHFLGWWTGPLERLYATFDICALASRSEGTPVALIEAMAAAKPVVATAVGGVPDVVEHGVTGLLVAPGDADGLANAMVREAGDPDLRRCLGAAGREHVALHHSIERLVDDVERLYGEVTHILR